MLNPRKKLIRILFTTKDLATSLDTVKAYYELTKPGIIRGNVLTAIAGFLFASQGNVDAFALAQTVLGVVFIIASGCVINNYIDRDIDIKMERTKNRALVTGKIKPLPALMFATILGVIGLLVLLAYINVLTALIGLVAFIFYVVVYGYAKRHSVHGTLVGSIPGALSLVAGYTAVTGRVDVTASLLFLIMAIWQMPHFYAIAIYRLKDYKAAGLPVISIKKGITATKLHIVAYIVVYAIASSLLTVFSYAGYVYLIAMLGMSGYWLWYASNSKRATSNDTWAKGVFGISLLVLLVFSFLISINNFLP